MADKLIFPIGFDLDAAVKDVQGNADKYIRQIESAMNRKPIVLKAEIDASKFQVFSRQFSNSIDGISAKLSQAQRLWNAMTFDVKFDADGNLSRRAQVVFDSFQQLTQASATMGQRLGEVNRSLAKSEADTAKLITAEYDKRKRQIDEQIRLKERQAAAEERVRQGQLKGVNVGYIDTQKQVEAVRNLRLQYEAILPMLNAMAQKRVNIRIGIDKQFEAEVNRINAEIARLRQSNLQLGSKGDVNAIQANLTAIRQLESELARINQQKIDIFNNNKIQGDLARLRSEVASVFGELQTAERKLASDNSVNAALDAQSQKVLKLHSDIQKLDQQIAQLNAQGKMYNADGTFSTQAISILQQRIALTKQLEQDAVTGQQAQIKLEQQLREEKRKTEQEAKNAAKEAERQAKAEAQARKQAIEAANAENKARQAAYNARVKQGKETQRILKAEENSIANITAKLQIQQQRLQTANLGSAKFNKIAEEVKRLTAELDKANKKMRDLTGATTTASARQSAAVKQVNEAYKSQDGYVSRLIKRLAVYAGFSMIGSFLTNIRKVTAQFELQRVSLGAIIQDQQRANQLFAEIKSFALTSPLKILDLTKYAKQVAAYGFETERIFDVTKRLADISVGLGVDMGRLTLAVSQIKAATVLKSSELRQLTETGLPMLDLLSKKLSETQGKIISTAEVMDLISKRAISYEMVEEVLYDLTNAGGMFYNMQVKQSQTLFGMWSKLGDAAALMYDQIGNTSSVNSVMKTTIGLLEKMMRNWQTTARVLDVVVMAIAVYAIGLKNANIASKALAGTTSLLNLAHKQQVIQTPKLVAALIGQNAAMRLSTILTKAHTAAVLQEAVATNVLTKGFWRLTAAMLANPWIAAAAAIGAAVAAIVHFTRNAETAADRAEKLNNSVASLKNLDDTVKPLIDTYNELIQKIERTAAEEKKLSEVTHELAKRYPGAITAIGNYGNEIELVADKLNELYQAEKNARMENTRSELEKTEQKIKETKNKIAQLQETLQKGSKAKVQGSSVTGGTQIINVELSENEKAKILKQIDELRYGKDGQSGLVGLEQSAENAGRALGLIPSEVAQTVEKFGAWKKELRSFRVEVEGGANMQLFDDSTLNQFKSLDEAMAAAAKDYKEQIELVEHYNKALAEMSATSESRAKIEAERAEAEAKANANLAAMTRFGYKPSDFDKSRGRGTQSDPRLGILQEMVSTLKQVNKEYDELAKKEGATKAFADTQRVYADTFKNMQQLAAKYKFELPDFDVPTDTASLTKYLDAIKTAMAKLPKSDKAVLALQVDIEKLNIDDMQKKIEQQLKDLSDKISHTKTAREFYDKILSQTGDVDLAANVTMSIYGDTGEGLFDSLVEQIRQSFTSGDAGIDLQITADIDAAIDTTNQRINYQKLAEIYEKYQDDIIEKNRDTAKKIVSEGQKTEAANILTWEKELAKAKDYEQQRTDIINRETQRRAEIYKSNLPQEEKDRLAAQSRKNQDEDIAKVNFEEFTKSEDYIKIFENLDNTSTAALKRLRKEMRKMIDTNKDLSPENMKTLVKAMEDIDEQISGRGFGNDMVQGVRDYIAALRDLKTARAELQTAQAEYDAQLPQLDADIETAKADEIAAQEALNDLKAQELQLDADIETAKADEIAAQEALNDLKAQELQDENAIVAAKLKLNSAAAAVIKAEQAKAKAAEKVKKAETKVTNQQDKQKKAINKINNDLGQVATKANQFADILGDVKDLLGVSEDSVAGIAFDSAIDSLQMMSKAIGIVTVAQELFNATTMANPYIAIVAAVLAVGVALASFIKNSKIKAANDEIEYQNKLLKRLEYAYGRLEDAAERAFGSDYISNYNQRLRILSAELSAIQAQIRAEQSKGKKADEDKVEDYLEQQRDIRDKINSMLNELSENFTGTDVASAAREFAEAWLDAYLSFESTTDAMKGKFRDMIKSMVVQSILAKTVQATLQPMFNQIDKLAKDGNLSAQDIALVMAQIPQYVEEIDNGMRVGMESLKAAGLDISSLRDTTGEFSGIAKNVASASSEDINANTAALNTQNFYMSQINANVAAIAQRTADDSGKGTVSLTDLVTIQNQHLSQLPVIAANTAATAERCERAAAACEDIARLMGRVITPKGVKSSFSVNTTIN